MAILLLKSIVHHRLPEILKGQFSFPLRVAHYLYVRMKIIKYAISGMSQAIIIYSTTNTSQAGSTSSAPD